MPAGKLRIGCNACSELGIQGVYMLIDLIEALFVLTL
jgi:hypothetical protein